MFSSTLRSGLWIALQQPDDGRVTFGSLDELVDGQLAVQVLVHLPEDFVCPLLGGRFVFWHLHHGADHLVDCLHGKKSTADFSWEKQKASHE